MAPSVARIGDPCSHGGSISTGSDDVLCNGLGVARVGDTYECPIHGPNSISTGSEDVLANGRQVARVGDETECGAIIEEGSPDTFAN